MIALCFFACLALASAAPQFEFNPYADYLRREPYVKTPARDSSVEDFFNGQVFDTQRFWAEMAAEFQKIDQVLSELYTHFPATTSEHGIKGNEYVITMSLTGFEENDIKVKAREGVLMVQAVHKSDNGNQRSYIDVKTLPSYVNVNGTWTYEAGILKIVFPLNSKPEISTEAVVTQAPSTESNIDVREKEEVEETHNQNANRDADVGLEMGERDQDNEIPDTHVDPVEATTYAVDLKDEVELVPVRKEDHYNINNFGLSRRY
ncbi:hypothetical protein NE865_03042 [Phthorimaea operculella]|nr:hypothetical protein NE865_03042 [Phthorimaea operculella]